MDGFVTGFLTNPDVSSSSWIDPQANFTIQERMLQQVLHLTKSYFLDEVGVEKFMVKRSWKQFLHGKW